MSEKHYVYSVPEAFKLIESIDLSDALAVLKAKLNHLQDTAQIAQFVGIVVQREIKNGVTLSDKTKVTVREYLTIVGYVLGDQREWRNTNFKLPRAL